MGRAAAPKPPNPLKGHTGIRRATPTIFSKAGTPAPAATIIKKTAAAPSKRKCINPECEDTNPKIEDGICMSCGAFATDSNIVAEIQFGESSSGAAVVQGSYVAADQGAARGSGPGFRRGGGGGDRANTINEAKISMTNLGARLGISGDVQGQALQIFKLAAMGNFIQGRRADVVASVCLYAACRRCKPCRVMLIDFADTVQVNVFKLGRTLKALLKESTILSEGLPLLIPEDLMLRFAMKLDFGEKTDIVAENACRLLQRMSTDWMVEGRRPSGVCGACLIMAARMNNFRRTVAEVVYVVKVTNATIQKRLVEFKRTPTSSLTIADFLTDGMLPSTEHDPPSIYEKSAEFLAAKAEKKRKRKRNGGDGDGEIDEADNLDGQSNEGAGQQAAKRSKTTDAPIPTVEPRYDAEGFAIPSLPGLATPAPSGNENIDPCLFAEVEARVSGADLDELVAEFDAEAGAGSRARSRSGSVELEWEAPEEEWAAEAEKLQEEIDEMDEMVMDPNTKENLIAFAHGQKQARFILLTHHDKNRVRMDIDVADDEFADDPEVKNCVLDDAEIAKKERLWFNENKDWLRKQQIKAYQKKLAGDKPKSTRAGRKMKPKIGEGQTAPAASAQEATAAMLKLRAPSRKINYSAINTLMSNDRGSAIGSAATSRVTSVAGSELGDDDDHIRPDSVAGGSVSGEAAIAGAEAGDDADAPAADETYEFEEFEEQDYDDPGMGEVDDTMDFGGRDDDDDDGYGGGYGDDDE